MSINCVVWIRGKLDTLMTHETVWGAYLDPPGGVEDGVGTGHQTQLARDPVLYGGGGPRARVLTVTVCVRRLLRLEVLRLELAGLGPFNFHFQTFITICTV